MRRVVWSSRSSTLLAAVLAIAGCASTPESQRLVAGSPTFETAGVDPIPLRVSWTYDPGLNREMVSRVPVVGGKEQEYRIFVGGATRAAFDKVLRALFVDSDKAAADRGVVGQIRIRLLSASALDTLSKHAASVTYALDFESSSGGLLYTWEVRGAGERSDRLEEDLSLAVRASAAIVAREMAGQPVVRAWLERDAPAAAVRGG